MRSAIFGHDNDYGFDPRTPGWPVPRLRVACVVPYFDTGRLGVECVSRLATAVQQYRAAHQDPPDTAILVVDDGSRRRPFPGDCGLDGVEVIRLPENRGRAVARNIGLRASAGFDVTVFVDSDVLVQPDQVMRTCALWGAPGAGAGSTPVVAHLFSTSGVGPAGFDPAQALAVATVAADWRWSCRFQPSWTAVPGDWMYVGRRFDLVRDTGFWRRWRGMVGPWSLPTMVAGGCMAVPTALALEAGGFDEQFAAYGFEEATLVARLIAAGVLVVPQVHSAAVHVEHNPAHHSQAERNQMLAAAHRRFYTEFLNHDLV
ncbi:glycosyltransferase family 2 protein [Nocardia terpenica]|uniref:glycosyltransferase family 2 protein n=1 Tax=Nocardia terpenica TaxID=455432 RepID=UPI0012FD87AE|nr:glycosyltransferase [Nocardia terpenica]